MAAPGPLDVFISYAEADEAHQHVLRKHLALLKREGKIRTLHAGRIAAGEHRNASLVAQIEAAHIIILLISADYLAADTQWHEMEQALRRHKLGQTRVTPILLDDCDWSSAPFSHLKMLPSDGLPVLKWERQNEAWAAIARGIRQSIRQQTVIMESHDGAPRQATARSSSAPELGSTCSPGPGLGRQARIGARGLGDSPSGVLAAFKIVSTLIVAIMASVIAFPLLSLIDFRWPSSCGSSPQDAGKAPISVVPSQQPVVQQPALQRPPLVSVAEDPVPPSSSQEPARQPPESKCKPFVCALQGVPHAALPPEPDTACLYLAQRNVMASCDNNKSAIVDVHPDIKLGLVEYLIAKRDGYGAHGHPIKATVKKRSDSDLFFLASWEPLPQDSDLENVPVGDVLCRRIVVYNAQYIHTRQTLSAILSLGPGRLPSRDSRYEFGAKCGDVTFTVEAKSGFSELAKLLSDGAVRHVRFSATVKSPSVLTLVSHEPVGQP
ncbi:TIR domain-containing protein [Sorangium sp. So ce406]|uniref:toll/interleukin-1 receptor domain-containing protein n=1 Tax=Sorangium sp. So ce406 TaxID=3133311 RepID=UPI003F5C637C